MRDFIAAFLSHFENARTLPALNRVPVAWL